MILVRVIIVRIALRCIIFDLQRNRDRAPEPMPKPNCADEEVGSTSQYAGKRDRERFSGPKEIVKGNQRMPAIFSSAIPRGR
jgi:hypothetical protein